MRDYWAIAAFQLAIVGLAAAFAALRTFSPEPLGRHPLVLVPLGMAGLAATQLAAGSTVSSYLTERASLEWITHAAAVWLAIQFASDSAIVRRWRLAMVIFTGAICTLGLVQNFTSQGRVFWLFDSGYQDLVLGPFVYRNKYAQFAELTIPFALFLSHERPGLRWWMWSVVAIQIAGIVAVGSRSGMAIVALELVCFALLTPFWGIAGRQKLRRARFLLPAATALVAGLALADWQFLGERFKTEPLQDLRWPMMRASLAMIADRPLTGFGLGTWATAYPAYALYDDGTRVNQAHCDWLQWPCEGGPAALVLMLGLAAAAFVGARKNPWAIGVCFVFLHGLVDYPMQQVPQFASLVLAVLAVGIVAPPTAR
jgi:O-antigen ligase